MPDRVASKDGLLSDGICESDIPGNRPGGRERGIDHFVQSDRQGGRMSKKIDSAVKALKILDRGCRESPMGMLKANLEYIVGKYMTQEQWNDFRVTTRSSKKDEIK